MRRTPPWLVRTLLAVSAIGVTAAGVVAEPVTCYAIRQGDTAALISLRLTGSVGQEDESWFYIVDHHSRVVPKSRYRLIHPGWQVCLASRRAEPPRPAIGVASDARAPRVLVTSVVGGAICGGAVLIAAWFAHAGSRLVRRRRTVIAMMQGFGERFVKEFERPLIVPGREERAVESRLHLIPRRQRLEILLAPSGGRRYPNLSDHRCNVAYDAERIVRRLNDERFVRGRLGNRGRWVVIECHFEIDMEQEGCK